ncbi:MAG: YjiH family protein [Spirochaetales bacterium]|nr:YjiH family protein [Spirochaetales bacterium]
MNNTLTETENYTSTDILRFLIPSLLGAFIFLFPLSIDGSMTIPLGVLIDSIRAGIESFGLQLVGITVLLSAAGSILTRIFKPDLILKHPLLKILFDNNTPTFILKLTAAAVTAALFLNLTGGVFDLIVHDDTGFLMMDLGITLYATFLVVVFVLPLISDYGLMDFTGTVFRRLIHPLFRLPGRSAVDLISSWVGGNAAGILVTIRQYESGFYTAREAVTISTMFSVVSLPFCLVIANTLGVGHLFAPLYGILILVGVLTTIVMVRIPPISRIDNSRYKGKKQRNSEEIPGNMSSLRWGFHCAMDNARRAGSVKEILKEGSKGTLDLIFNVIPMVIAIGTAGLVLAEHTPLFQWISTPFFWYLNVLGVDEAAAAAPTMVVGFTDMFLPAIIGSSIASVETRFIIAVVSLVQIIYLSEMAAVLLASSIPIKLKDLIVIFVIKTVIALPLTVLFTRLLGLTGLFG